MIKEYIQSIRNPALEEKFLKEYKQSKLKAETITIPSVASTYKHTMSVGQNFDPLHFC